MEQKRVFLGVEIQAPWPEKLPHGRLLAEEDRHATLAFLGEVSETLLSKLQKIPLPLFKVGFTGFFSELLLLPPRRPQVVAWNISWEAEEKLTSYRQSLLEWLKKEGYHPREHEGPWLSHATLCRKPFDSKDWINSFTQLPLMCTALHLYESLGHSKYKPLTSYRFIAPFEEIEHTADIAYLIYGETLSQIYDHALTALAFRDPKLLSYVIPQACSNLDDVIVSLNDLIGRADADNGCPFKAISYHGNIEENNNVLQWEMIVDV